MSNYLDEGYIKFHLFWEESSAPSHPLLDNLIKCRNNIFDLKLIGFDDVHQVGYGNISIKTMEGFIISATQTGHILQVSPQDFSLVYDYNIAQNSVSCRGKTKASSESLTHAALYECANDIKSIIHVHHEKMWKSLLHKIPTTSENISYGTPQMAYEIQRLFKETELPHLKIAAMAGHFGGIIAFGNSIEEAENILLQHFSS